MLTSICIKSFRGLQNVEIAPLKRVNLIMGQNNAGKTGVLEALALLLSDKAFSELPRLFRPCRRWKEYDDWQGQFDPNARRQPTVYEHQELLWEWLFPDKNLKSRVEVSGTDEHMKTVGALAQYGDENRPENVFSTNSQGNIMFYRTGVQMPKNQVSILSTHPTDPQQDAIDYNRVVLRRKRKQVENLLREVEPRLEAIESIQTGTAPLLYADIGLSEMIPITQMGQGFNRLLDIYSEIVAAESKVLLIDEIENGLHHSVLPTIWRGLFNAAEEVGVQIFATTHSWECVLAADQAAQEDETYELNLIRLDRVDGQVKATVIDQPALETAKELHWEMR